jgi:ketosteroid isomerase-like protein
VITSSPNVEAAVLRANATFYRAFTACDYAAMSKLWAERAPVACLHPGAPVLVGRESVLESFRQLLRGPAPLEMRCDQARVHLLSETAIVLCYEGNARLPAHLAATNVFTLEDQEWRMIHHHAGPLARAIASSGSSMN